MERRKLKGPRKKNAKKERLIILFFANFPEIFPEQAFQKGDIVLFHFTE